MKRAFSSRCECVPFNDPRASPARLPAAENPVRFISVKGRLSALRRQYSRVSVRGETPQKRGVERVGQGMTCRGFGYQDGCYDAGFPAGYQLPTVEIELEGKLQRFRPRVPRTPYPVKGFSRWSGYPGQEFGLTPHPTKAGKIRRLRETMET